MKQTLQLKLSQHLTLTPQLQQSIRLLQLSTMELNQEVERMLQENPLLERAEAEEEVARAEEFPLASPKRPSARRTTRPTAMRRRRAARTTTHPIRPISPIIRPAAATATGVAAPRPTTT